MTPIALSAADRRKTQRWHVSRGGGALDPKELSIEVDGVYSPAEAMDVAFRIIDAARELGGTFSDPKRATS